MIIIKVTFVIITLIVFGINIFMLLIFYQKEDCFHSGGSNSYFYVDNAYDKTMIEKMKALHLMLLKMLPIMVMMQ